MKARFLVSCILLSTLVLLLLSSAVRAAEYSEVKAEEIITKIENGQDVFYSDCRIVGELNASKMKLETVSMTNTLPRISLTGMPTIIASNVESSLESPIARDGKSPVIKVK